MTIADYSGRVTRLQTLMVSEGIDSVLLSVGSDLPYFSGYQAMPTERLTILVIGQSDVPVLFVPVLEAPRVEAGSFEIVGWSETEDPIALASAAVGSVDSIAVGDQMWSTFLIGLQKTVEATSWMPASKLTRRLRIRKEPAELESLRSAAHAVDRVMARIPDEVHFAGHSEREVAQRLAEMTVEEGHETSAHAIVAAGANGASPHHEPGTHEIENGDLVVCDFGGRMGGYYSDSTRTFSVGEPSRRQQETHDLVEAANLAGQQAVGVGVPCSEVDDAARSVIEEAGFGEFFIHRTGHGIGLDVHEHPYIVEDNPLPLEEGMTFSIEPGIYLADEFGVRIEDIVACGPDGVDTMNLASRQLVAVS